MSLLGWLTGKKEKETDSEHSNTPDDIQKELENVSKELVLNPENEKKEQIPNPENEKKEQYLKLENDKKVITYHDDSERMNQVLTEIKALYILLRDHDDHLTLVDNNIIGHISELMTRKKIASEEVKLEVEAILKTSSDRKEAIERLRDIGIPQSTAYKYTEFLIKPENEKKETSQQPQE
jgi:hypothetical protein